MNKYLPYIVFVLVNLAFLFSAYFYPPLRDEFYYLDKASSINVFTEYRNSYFFGNPRIGQFFCNAVSRDLLIRAFFGLFVFNAFFALLFLNVFRKLPSLKKNNDFVNLSIIIVMFVFLINVFGEMFYYTPFSGNYTFLMCFHLLCVFVMTEYFIFNKNILLKKYFSVPLIIFLGVFTGMGNEHIPPVLIGSSFLASAYYLWKFKRLPNYKILVYQITLVIGYLLLFFAPANSVKYKTLGKQSLGLNSQDYFTNFKNVLNFFRYYNAELIICTALAVIIAIVLLIRNKSDIQSFFKIAVLLFLGLLTIPIVAYAPLSGTRLLFFCNTLFFIFIASVLLKLNIKKSIKNRVFVLSAIILLLFFSLSCIISFNGHKNYEKVIGEIKKQKESTDQVILPSSFDYYTPELGDFNRRFFLDQGLDYIDRNPEKDTSQEMLLKNYYHVKKLSISK